MADETQLELYELQDWFMARGSTPNKSCWVALHYASAVIASLANDPEHLEEGIKITQDSLAKKAREMFKNVQNEAKRERV